MITIELTPRVVSLTDLLYRAYDTLYRQTSVYDLGNGYAMLVSEILLDKIDTRIMRPPGNKMDKFYTIGWLHKEELEEYAQKLDKVLNDRLEEEAAPFTVLIKPFPAEVKGINYSRIGFKLDYSEYAGTEDTELLNI